MISYVQNGVVWGEISIWGCVCVFFVWAYCFPAPPAASHTQTHTPSNANFSPYRAVKNKSTISVKGPISCILLCRFHAYYPHLAVCYLCVTCYGKIYWFSRVCYSEHIYSYTCLRSNWCELLLLHKSQYLNKDTKERKKVSLKLNKNYLNIPSVSTTERISKLKRRM